MTFSTQQQAEFSDLLKQGLTKLSLPLSEVQQKQLLGYLALMNKWNKAYNLTSVREPKDMLIRHVLDSLSVAQFIQPKTYIDVGTGPGLPGIPLAIAFPEARFYCLDSLGKRVRFMKQTCFELAIQNVVAVQSRVEAYSPPERLDGVLSRAFASLNDMVNCCRHLIDDTAEFLALKGQYPQDELSELPDDIQIVSTHSLDVPFLVGERNLIVLKKRV
ncbi:16S rRNA (guanine(527)-N(7))-methyltransferase RsmG [Alteromonas oceanisediminis]|uniref:16S rRNA (guanine(527)-N(7))-methyltransferase RsmG n=1 Tax=Alteromonas oceanisediminis TaxID=2836180 RepID=UPI001BD99A42|nr:16S rRNA (guanine(527)-N(7))-methyltransferase RsmG [Alteromonas oceanisediminis]MBT0586718.1 16S rRNA (guanine(527)-N(7))-methyltransferase RsmG [Alteromonas oceanisediminis]